MANISSDGPLRFNQDKRYYPLIINYLAAIHGSLELLSRYMIALAAPKLEFGAPIPLQIPSDSPLTGDQILEFYSHPRNRETTRLPTPFGLKYSFREERTIVNSDDVAKEFGDHHVDVLPWLMRSAGAALLITAYEMSEEFHFSSPIWEFLRHCRNAAAHDGCFTFDKKKKEPRNEAVWRDFVVTEDMEGTRLFKGPGNGLMWPGDPVHLLWDIEQLIT